MENDAGMQGTVSFSHSGNGWRVDSVWPCSGEVVREGVQVIEYSEKKEKLLSVVGKFKKALRPGQFCKRPHELLETA